MSQKDTITKAYEDYVLSDKNIEIGLKNLVEGSDSYNYLKCIDFLTKKGAKLTEEELQLVNDLIRKNNREIELRYEFLKYDNTKDPAEKAEIIDKFANDQGYSFNDQKPADFGQKAEPETVTDKKRSKEQGPILEAFDINPEIEKIYKRSNSVTNFSSNILSRLDFSRLSKEDFMILLNHMGKDIMLLDSQGFYDSYVKFLEADYNDHNYYTIDSSIVKNMTISQLDKLIEALPKLNEDINFVIDYLAKKFYKELSKNAHIQEAERRKNLIKIYEYVKDFPKKIQGLKSNLLFEILKNGIKLGLYEEEYFLAYLKAPLRENYSKKKVAQNPSHWDWLLKNIRVNLQKDNEDTRAFDKKILKKYLEHFLMEDPNIERFKQYLEKMLLVLTREQIMLTTGKKVKITPENAERLERLNALTEITVCESNNEVFSLNEEVKIQLELKNVPTLYVKVFEINAENYYKSKMNPIRSDINLEGLVSSIERVVDHKEPPQIRYREEIKFPELQGKKGVFIIEFIGNGISARAVIKLGLLSVISVPTVAGQICYILDEKGKKCVGPKTSIYIDGNNFSASQDQPGRICIPYVSSGTNSSAILLHDGNAQLIKFQRLEEDYYLRCGFFLLPEEIISGATATIAIRPQLFINERIADCALLKNIKCSLTTSNFLDDIKCTKRYENLVLSQRQEVLVKFEVPANLKDLSIEFSAEIFNVSKQENKVLSNDSTFPIKTHVSDSALLDFYLRMTPEGYIFSVLGKNGEPAIGIGTTFLFTPSCFSQDFSKNGVTNELGEINLGKLKGISKFTARVYQSSGSIFSEWHLAKPTKILYPKNINVLEGETIEIPIPTEKLSEQFYLQCYDNEQVLENLSKSIKTEQKPGMLYGLIKLANLKCGDYSLWEDDEIFINISVHKGEYWIENKDYILKQTSLIECGTTQESIRFRNVTLEEKEGKKFAKLQVDGFKNDQWRVHAFLFRYLPNDLSNLTEKLLEKNKEAKSEHNFNSWRNFYLSNRQLPSETRYCLDRRSFKKFTGNTLDKPKLVLRREFVKYTHTRDEDMDEGRDYDNIEEEELFEEQAHKEKPKRGKKMKKKGPSEKNKKGDKSKKGKRYKDRENEGSNNEVTLYQNFIGTQPLAAFNLPASPDGALTIELDNDYDRKYSCMYFIAVDKGSVAHFLKPLTGNNLSKRDLTLATPLDSKKNYCEIRTSSCVFQNESHAIQDTSSTNYQIIDSIAKVLDVLKEIHTPNYPPIEEIKKFEPVINWDKFNEEEKNATFSRLASHEFNLFLYKKDPAYFEQVVKPYLRNKMEQTLIDFYLLQDNESAIVYAETPALYTKLNALEKALLIEMLVQVGKKDMALTLSRRLRDSMVKKRKSASEINRIFDTVISLNIKKEENKIDKVEPIPKPTEAPSIPASQQQQIVKNEKEAAYHKKAEMKPKMMYNRIQQNLQECGEAKEYVETQYFTGALDKNTANRVQDSDFYADYAEHVINNPKKSFLSSYFIQISQNITEVMSAIALLDIPFNAGEHGFKSTGPRSSEIKAASDFIIFKKEIKETNENPRSDILVAQRYIDSELEKECSESIKELLVNRVYACEVIITNISSHKLELGVFCQIPQGSIPAFKAAHQRSFSVVLNSYSTTSIQYKFYFPSTGNFAHFPANVSVNSEVVAKATATTLKVVKEKTALSQTNFRDVLSTGNIANIINMMRHTPLEKIKGFNWQDVMWLLKDKAFFDQLIALLKEQRRFVSRVWQYSFYHKGNDKLMAEYLNSIENEMGDFGFYFTSSLIKVRPKNSLRHCDFYPLINPRAHKTSTSTDKCTILNVELSQVYKNFLEYLIQKPQWELSDKMNLTYYLLLQDKIKEALSIYAKINPDHDIPKEGTLRLQYDYMAAYLDFYTGSPKFALARKIVAQYLNYPVNSWKLMFLEIDQQLKEYDGKIATEAEEVTEEASKTISMKSQPSYKIRFEGKEIVIEYANTPEVTIKFYLIELEALFSRAPFLSQEGTNFSFVQPDLVQTAKLDPALKVYKHKIPEAYHSKNISVVVEGSGLQERENYFFASLKVQIFENYGELKVVDEENKAISQVYVKLFARNKDSTISFYKDGYIGQ